MLVINGRLHPRFDRRSTSLKARTGVGVGADGEVMFAISRGEVSFNAFARLFRDGLNCDPSANRMPKARDAQVLLQVNDRAADAHCPLDAQPAHSSLSINELAFRRLKRDHNKPS